MSGNLSHIRGIIWDLDGTLYRYDDAFRHACNLAASRLAIKMGLDLAPEDALALAIESEATYGNSFKLFGERGLVYRDFHIPYHDAVDVTILQKNAAMKKALERLELPMVILTNASRGWARRTLAHIELDHLFPNERILALEDVGYMAKSYHTAGFERALEILGTHAVETLLVEDLARNLPMAKKMALTTALVHHGQIPGGAEAHVDMLFENTLDLVETLLDSIPRPGQAPACPQP